MFGHVGNQGGCELPDFGSYEPIEEGISEWHVISVESRITLA